jgi:hypothetical protein
MLDIYKYITNSCVIEIKRHNNRPGYLKFNIYWIEIYLKNFGNKKYSINIKE